MSRRPMPATQPPAMAPAQAPAPNSRQNEYFIPRDGIDREVITSDICRYLGNDALVRPGTYEDPKTRQSISGYFITAYRNLTTAMIDDLKADSSRWEQERRAKSSRNAAGVQYSHSDTYARRQQGGPSEHAYGNARDSYDQRSPHPGPDGPGYPGGYASQPPPGGQYMQPNPQGGYPSGNPGTYPSGGYPGAPQSFPQPDSGFPQSGQQGTGYQSGQDSWVHGAARPIASGYREPSQFPPGGMGTRDPRLTTPPSQGSYAPPQHHQQGYPPAGGEYYNGQPGPYQTMPQDHHYGRGGQYQERTTSPPSSNPQDRFATTATAPTPQSDAYGSMQGQQPTAPAPPRRQGGHR